MSLNDIVDVSGFPSLMDIAVPYDSNFNIATDIVKGKIVPISDNSQTLTNVLGISSKLILKDVEAYLATVSIYVMDGAQTSMNNFCNKRTDLADYIFFQFVDAETSLLTVDICVIDIVTRKEPKLVIVTSRYFMYVAHKLKLLGAAVTTIVSGVFRNVEDITPNVSTKDVLIESKSVRKVAKALDTVKYDEPKERPFGAEYEEHKPKVEFEKDNKNNTDIDSEEDQDE